MRAIVMDTFSAASDVRHNAERKRTSKDDAITFVLLPRETKSIVVSYLIGDSLLSEVVRCEMSTCLDIVDIQNGVFNEYSSSGHDQCRLVATFASV